MIFLNLNVNKFLIYVLLQRGDSFLIQIYNKSNMKKCSLVKVSKYVLVIGPDIGKDE